MSWRNNVTSQHRRRLKVDGRRRATIPKREAARALMGSEKKCLKDDRFLYLDGFLLCFRMPWDERVLGRECAVRTTGAGTFPAKPTANKQSRRNGRSTHQHKQRKD